MKDSIIILCGGGPAPGMNTVVCSVAKTFLSNGFRVIGLHGGYSGLFSKTPRTEDIDFFKADAYFNRGGSYLQMSRFKPTDEATSTFRRPSTTTFLFLRMLRLSVSTQPRMKVRTSRVRSTRTPALPATGCSFPQWDAPLATSPSESVRRPTAR